MKKILTSFVVIAASISMTACQKTQEQFDFSKKAPDEFAVVKRAPLEMPPDFEVRAPRPGAPRPQEQATDQLAREAILGEDARKTLAKKSGVSEGEAVLLQKTGAANASSAIRAQVDKETAEIIKDEAPGIDKLKRMVGQDPAEPAPELVDPVAEANRIKQNKAQGKPVTAGKTPKKSDD
jgi:predicted small lipoprotein YifL